MCVSQWTGTGTGTVESASVSPHIAPEFGRGRQDAPHAQRPGDPDVADLADAADGVDLAVLGGDVGGAVGATVEHHDRLHRDGGKLGAAQVGNGGRYRV
jgi:hypothetical protein